MTAICPKCGRDCRTALALGKHEAKGCDAPRMDVPDGWIPPLSEDALVKGCQVSNQVGDYISSPSVPQEENWPGEGRYKVAANSAFLVFSDRHQTKTEKCPKCCEIWADFLILDENTWVCLSCGCHFMPREKLNQINDWKLKDAERRRTPQTA